MPDVLTVVAKIRAAKGKGDALAALLRARRDVVVLGEFAALHAAPVIDNGQRAIGLVRQEVDARGTRVERIGDDLGKDRLFERTGIGVSQILEQVLDIDSGFTHARILQASWPTMPRP